MRETFNYDFEDPDAATSCRLLVVALLVVDETALGQLEETGQVNALVSHFNAASDPTKRYRDQWINLQQGNSFMDNLPEAVRRGVKIYERSYVLNPNL